MAIKLADTARPNNYVDAEHPGTFPVAYAEDVWFEDGTRLSEKTFDNENIQKEELPPASIDELGKIYQYIGETGTYTKGYFYECVSNGETPSTYYWKEAVGGSGYQFSEDFVDEDNNVSLAPTQRIFTGTQSEWDALTTVEKKTYGQVNITDDDSTANYEVYSTEEVKTNKVWIDGKPIYRVVRHVWDTGNVPATGYSFSGTMLSGPLTNNAESLIKVVILCKNTQGCWQELTGNGENGPAQNFVWFSDTSAYFIHAGTLDGAWAIFEYTKTTD